MTRSRIERRFDVDWVRLTGLALAPRMTAPLTVFHDRQDREVPWQDSHSLVGRWRGAKLHLTEGLGHRRILRDQKVISSSLHFLEA